MRDKDPSVPALPEGKNPIFIAYPICMIISLVLAILWLGFRKFERLIHMTMAGCLIGISLMLAAGILEMRHAELYINLAVVSDAELMEHPIFMHNFFMCIISILAMVIYLVHFWILCDCWQWQKRESEDGNGSSSSEETPERASTAETSRRSDYESSTDPDAATSWSIPAAKSSDLNQKKLDREPVILYCCCVDCWRYIRDRNNRKPIHEFQVVQVK